MISLHPYLFSALSDAPVPDPTREAGDSSFVILRGEAGDDLYFEPGTFNRVSQLRPLGTWIAEQSFQFSARVRVDFVATFDSAVLLGWFDPDRWFKICAELDPQGRRRVVSVVTRGRSDDSNGALLSTDDVVLRVARTGQLIALHSSADGQNWDLVRIFDINSDATEPMFLGIAVQSPTGDGTPASFDEITLMTHALAQPRNGS